MPCKDCRNPLSTHFDDVRRLYAPPVSSIAGKPSCGIGKCNIKPPYYIRPRCVPDCRKRRNCCDKYKNYWAQNSDISCLGIYENQAWFEDPLIKEGWADFVGDIVTPQNIDCRLQPGPDDCGISCHKVRALMGPAVCCTWDLPDIDECATRRYGYNRDWRRYNEDQRMEFSDMVCGCTNEPICKPKKCEWPPYLGKKYGARYMSWAHPLNFMFSRPRVFNYQSNPFWC